MKKAIILLSGGLDSTTCLAIAKSQGFACYALSFNYSQRNKYELEVAKAIAKDAEVVEHRIVDLNINQWGGSALTDLSLDIPTVSSDEVPITYVPARNTIFLSIALGFAEAVEAHDIFIGVNAVDYSNYPDCRPEYIEAFTKVANLATREGVEGRKMNIHTPLIALSKAEIIKMGVELGVDYSKTLTCYDPDEKGLACGQCDACRFRAKGFKDASINDVTRYKPLSS